MASWSVDVSTHFDDLPVALTDRIEAAALWVLDAEKASDAEISVALVGDDEMERLNREYLSHDGTTDVISFPLVEPGLPLVGDIYVGAEQARRQAAELGIDFGEELLRLVVHGMLHLLGWEHPEAERAESPMYRRQEELLKQVMAV